MVTISRAEYEKLQAQSRRVSELGSRIDLLMESLLLEGENLVCPNCGETMTEIGTEIARPLEIIPARTVVKEHIYHTYVCQKCSKEGTETPIVKPPREKNIIPGSIATLEAISHIIPHGTCSYC